MPSSGHASSNRLSQRSVIRSSAMVVCMANDVEFHLLRRISHITHFGVGGTSNQRNQWRLCKVRSLLNFEYPAVQAVSKSSSCMMMQNLNNRKSATSYSVYPEWFRSNPAAARQKSGTKVSPVPPSVPWETIAR